MDVKIYTCAPLPVCQIFDSENLYQFLSFFFLSDSAGITGYSVI